MRDPWEVAAWRFELIAPFMDACLVEAEKRRLLKDLTAKEIAWPSSNDNRNRRRIVRRVSRASLKRWLAAYGRKGIQGLLPNPRKRSPAKYDLLVEEWVRHAMRLLFERPDRSLSQLGLYLQAAYPGYSLSRSTLHRRIRAHPSYPEVQKSRSGPKRRLRVGFEASRPHQLWQLDGKGPFRVKLARGRSVRVHVLSILDDRTRMVLGATIAKAEDTAAAVRVFRRAACIWGLPERIQFDRGSAFESWTFRKGLAQLGSHRNWMRARNPQANGKIERYHLNLARWFVKELPHQEVVDLVHLEELLQAVIELVYNDHPHRELGMSPRQALAGRTSDRRVTETDLHRVFWDELRDTSDRKTGRIRLPNGVFRVPVRFAGERRVFRYDPSEPLAVIVAGDDREIPLEIAETKHPFDDASQELRRGAGELQKILDRWRGHERPLAEPGFGLPEFFALLSETAGRETPSTEDEARHIRQFYESHGPLAGGDIRRALARAQADLGRGRALTAYLDHLARQIHAAGKPGSTQESDPNPSHTIGEDHS